MCRVSLLRPAPSELPQGGNAARVGSCSGAIEVASPLFSNLSILRFVNLSMSSNSPIQDNLIVDKTFQFAVRNLSFSSHFQRVRQQIVIPNQHLKFGTSIGANVSEAQNSENLAEFIHKFKIATKEALNNIEPEIIRILLTEIKDYSQHHNQIISSS